jgi:hypothetical protein
MFDHFNSVRPAILVYIISHKPLLEMSNLAKQCPEHENLYFMNKQLVRMLSCLAAAVAGTEGGNTENNTPTLNF